VVQPAEYPVVLDLTPEEYYQAPFKHAQRLYAAYRKSTDK
jgi:hypothetical protein